MLLLVQLCAARRPGVQQEGYPGDLLHTRDPGDLQQAGDPNGLPCPDASHIFPCVCTVIFDSEMDMNCSAVQSEEQLARVFSVDFPYPDFHSLTIWGNDHLKVLRAGALGPTSYRRIYIIGGVLDTVEPTALSGSYNTAYDMGFYNNMISVFPFDEISLFTGLYMLFINDNLLTTFPTISSTTLGNLFIYNNPLGAISPGALQQLPVLTTIDLENTELQEILPGNVRCCSQTKK